MVLIDALFINNGGGKILLDYLIKELEKTEALVFYLLDARLKNEDIKIKHTNFIQFLNGSFLERYFFYKKNASKFLTVLCFGNLPPNIKIEAIVYTYFHQPMYLNIPKEFSIKELIKFNLKIAVLRKITRNTTFWLVQSDLIKVKLQEKFDILPQQVKVLPFYPQFLTIKNHKPREKNSYIYVSNGNPHKNHKRLIHIFCEFYDRHQKGKLILTINEDYPILNTLIAEKVNKGYPIENIGFVDRNTLQNAYLATEFLIFPSLTESFGLGLIEAIECGCKVIGADLSYTYEVCEPSIVFNPLSNESMLIAFEESLRDDVIESIPKIKNNIGDLIINLQNII